MAHVLVEVDCEVRKDFDRSVGAGGNRLPNLKALIAREQLDRSIIGRFILSDE